MFDWSESSFESPTNFISSKKKNNPFVFATSSVDFNNNFPYTFYAFLIESPRKLVSKNFEQNGVIFVFFLYFRLNFRFPSFLLKFLFIYFQADGCALMNFTWHNWTNVVINFPFDLAKCVQLDRFGFHSQKAKKWNKKHTPPPPSNSKSWKIWIEPWQPCQPCQTTFRSAT